MNFSDLNLDLPIPKPLSLKRKRLFSEAYEETVREPFCCEFTSNETYCEEENEHSVDAASKSTVLSAIESLTNISRQLLLCSHKLRCSIKENSERELQEKVADYAAASNTVRRKSAKELAKTLTELQLYGKMSVWSDDMRFIFYSLIKGKRNLDRGSTIEPSKAALEFLEKFYKDKT